MPCPFTVPKMFCAGPNFLSQPKNLIAFSASSKPFVSAQKTFYWMQIVSLSGTKYLWLPQYENEFLVWHKNFGLAQNILGPVKGQGIKLFFNGALVLIYYFKKTFYALFLEFKNILQHFKFVDWRIGEFVFWYHEQVIGQKLSYND